MRTPVQYSHTLYKAPTYNASSGPKLPHIIQSSHTLYKTPNPNRRNPAKPSSAQSFVLCVCVCVCFLCVSFFVCFCPWAHARLYVCSGLYNLADILTTALIPGQRPCRLAALVKDRVDWCRVMLKLQQKEVKQTIAPLHLPPPTEHRRQRPCP